MSARTHYREFWWRVSPEAAGDRARAYTPHSTDTTGEKP